MDLVPFPKPEPEIKSEEEILDEVKPELESEEELPDELKSELESEEELPDDLKSEIESEEEVLDELLKEDEIKSAPQDSVGIDQEAECATVLISADGKCVIVCQACNGFFDDIDPFRSHVEKVHSDYVVRGNAWGKVIKEEPTVDKTIDMTALPTLSNDKSIEILDDGSNHTEERLFPEDSDSSSDSAEASLNKNRRASRRLNKKPQPATKKQQPAKRAATSTKQRQVKRKK